MLFKIETKQLLKFNSKVMCLKNQANCWYQRIMSVKTTKINQFLESLCHYVHGIEKFSTGPESDLMQPWNTSFVWLNGICQEVTSIWQWLKVCDKPLLDTTTLKGSQR